MKKRFFAVHLIVFLVLFTAILKADNVTFDTQAILISPQNIRPGEVVRILLAFEEDLTGTKIEAVSPKGVLKPLYERRSQGVTTWVLVAYNIPSEGLYQIDLKREGETLSSASFDVDSKKVHREESRSVWSAKRQWSRDVENL